MFDLGRIIATEARALWVAGATEEFPRDGTAPHIGLDCWSPNINIARDPRWGRNQEVPSEDPLLNGIFGTQYTLGIQGGDDSRFINVAVTLKHWDAYSLENSDGYTRYNFNAVISNFSLADTYWPAFQAAVQKGRAKGVMCSYNAVRACPRHTRAHCQYTHS
jgi:beta-D-xylosidase 4